MLRVVALAAGLCTFSASAVETMRIAMGEATQGEVELTGPELGIGQDREQATYRTLGDRVIVRRVNGRLEVDGAPFPGDAVRFRSGKAGIRALGTRVRGDVVVRPFKGGLQLINVIPLEDYLSAVLGSEMPRSFPLEALKAQAVAARTYALHKKIGAYDASFHMGSSVLHQVYGGMGREDARTRSAVQQTWGEVLTFELAPIEAYFHATCGGRTEHGLDALQRDLPYLEPVGCPCETLAVSHWKLTLSEAELRKGLGMEAETVRVLSRSPTGRVKKLALGNGTLDAVTFRRKLGYQKVKSLAFEVQVGDDGRFLLSGRGNGHGAGLCQWGAKLLAEKGWDYRRILAHYYPGTEMQLLY